MDDAIPLTRDIDKLREWIGSSRTVTDTIDARRARLMEATLDREPQATTGDALPPFWHYIYFNDEIPASRLKEDGHERLGGFLPPVDLPRRMWAGGRVEIYQPLRIGQQATKTSTVTDITLKSGRSGALCFVTVEHRFEADGEPCFTETQNIVYREMPSSDTIPPAGKPAPEDPQFHKLATTDPVMLFRYSALIFYGHRIHYDIDYTRDVEGYPGLVVHGPLSVALLTDMAVAQNPQRRLRSFDIRAHSPIFCGDPVHLELCDDGDAVTSWARTEDGTLSMAVTAQFDAEQEVS
ncbi:MaoC family dehydratase N-terminal domain-containing protein [Ahrensia sp. R2A130]|uniref:FAS1-like dehydratase domain-containing protein n=1 Tax=Ahrensia sp. R2A130 TaxID=744979 RepID=UPI0001E0E10F|nr:MaoC family dehydratase N-terminal domain-containing protein [Ahrensia sp. R2A130]EFL87550.1 itaconyl-CoA hydratase [Ahrensia sp. R2A130]